MIENINNNFGVTEEKFHDFKQKIKLNEDLITGLYIKYSGKLGIEIKTDPKKLFFELEKIYWEYLKNYKESESFLDLTFKRFCRILVQNSDLYGIIDNFDNSFREYNLYRKCIPVCGFIMINKNKDKVLLVKSRFSDYWGFPKGKVAEGEDYLECGIRETLEETGFKLNRKKKYPKLELKHNGRTQILFLATNIDEEFIFKPIDFEEISEVSFFSFDNLPDLTGNVIPFIPTIKNYLQK